MGEPENQMHNYAFPPSVANWVHSTTLATQLEGSTDEPTESEPDAFYRPPQNRQGDPQDMTTSRLRQQTSNGAVPTAPKPSLRSASSPVSSTLTPKKSTPNLPGNRPAVRSLVQKFNQPISPEQQTSLPRVRPTRPTTAARSTTSPEGTATTSTSSNSRPTPAYGPHKFPNLKQRERPQPAPPSPARVRRANASRSSFDEQTASSRNKIASPTKTQKPQTGALRQPFFGEVVGDQNGVLSPGYGIPTFEETEQETTEPNGERLGSSTAIKSPAEDNHLLPSMAYSKPAPVRHGRSPSEMTQSSIGDSQGAIARSSPRRDVNRSSPPSRIPKPKRPTSTTSDSSNSTRSSINQALGNGRMHPISPHSRRHIGKENSPREQRKGVAQTPLQPISFLEYRERQKSPKGASNGASLTAVITATPPQTSPRLRNSRERQLLPHSDPRARSRSAERFLGGDLDEPDDSPVLEKDSNFCPGQVDESPISENASHCTSTVSLTDDNCSDDTTDAEAAFHQRAPSMDQHSLLDHSHESATTSALEALNLDMSDLQEKPAGLESTPATEFEYTESPVLGMPGSFMMTPPIDQSTPKVGTITADEQTGQAKEESRSQNEELLQPRAFHPRTTSHERGAGADYNLPSAASEVSVGETIPIMLGSDTHGMGWNGSSRPDSSSHRVNAWRAGHMNASTGSLSYLDEVDSPIDPFGHRSSIRPDDSASVAFFRPRDDHHDDLSPDQTPKISQSQVRSEGSTLTLDSEAYSVINRVLDLYHQSTYVTPEMASQLQQQIQAVSPAIAQHKDWDSKDATTSYLTRVLSDANSSTVSTSEGRTLHTVSEHQPTSLPSLHFGDDDGSGAEAGGTAIIFPSESRRYSRGSRGSNATTIWEDGSRADSASVNRSREHLVDTASHEVSYPTVEPPRSSYDFSGLLPEIETAGSGLGLSLQAQAAGAGGSQQQVQMQHQQQQPQRSRPPPPPAPNYTPPPPPPGMPSFEHAASQAHQPAPYTPSIYTRHPPSTIDPAHPLPENNSDPRMYSRRRDFAYPPPSPGDANGLMPAPLNVAAPKTNGQQAAPSAMGPPATKPTAEAQIDATTKALKKRLHIIKEILDTENAFGCDMVVIDKMFRYTCDELLNDKEERTLFGNSAELCDFAEMFFIDLKKSVKPLGHYKQPLKAKTKSSSKARKSRSGKSGSEAEHTEGGISDGKSVKDRKSADFDSMTVQNATLQAFANLTVENDRKTRIGATFMNHMQQIEKVFKTYLLNHENANEFLKTIIANERIQEWQKACIGHAEGLTQAWDLDSLLVKPTQRIMKYPLLLSELKAVTPTDHPDYPNIEAAHKEILEITMRINLEKKKMETLRAATKEGKKKSKGANLLEVRLGKGFVKAFGRKTDKIKQHAGLSEIFDDPDYNYQSQRFGGHFFQLQIILRDIENYLEKLTINVMDTNCLVMGFLNMLESNPTCPEIESQWRRNAMAFMELQNKALEEHKNGIQTLVIQKIVEVWKLYVGPQTLMEERKKGLVAYAKYKTLLNKGDKIDKKLQDAADRFITINNTLKVELPKLYAKTKAFIGWCLQSLIHKQMEWWMKCQRKIYPLLEQEPSQTPAMTYDLKIYVDRFSSDFSSILGQVSRLAICNHGLLTDMSHFTSPLQSYYSDDGSSRKSASASRRTHSLSSDVSTPDGIRRRSGGLAQRPTDGSHGLEAPPRSSPTARSFAATAASRALSPGSERSDATVTPQGRHHERSFMGLDGAMDYSPTPSDNSFLSPSRAHMSRSSTVFSSALPMSDSPAPSPSRSSNPSLTDQDEPEVLFLAASLFEFNIAHDRREGGIPYLVYVPGEIFDVIGMKGELWLARNQDDATRTVGWIWEKHFARILPEDA